MEVVYVIMMSLFFGCFAFPIGAWYQREKFKRERAEEVSRMEYRHWIEEAVACMRTALHLYRLMKDKECKESMDTVSYNSNPFIKPVESLNQRGTNRASIRARVLGETVFAQISKDKEDHSEMQKKLGLSAGWSKSSSVSNVKYHQEQEELYWREWDSSCNSILTDVELSDGYSFYRQRIQDIEDFKE